METPVHLRTCANDYFIQGKNTELRITLISIMTTITPSPNLNLYEKIPSTFFYDYGKSGDKEDDNDTVSTEECFVEELS